MKQKRIFDLIIQTKNNVSEDVLLWKALRDSYYYDEIHASFSGIHESLAKEIIFRLKLMGWMESESEPELCTLTKTRCLSCKHSMKGKFLKCEKCNSEKDLDIYTIKYKKVILNKRADLEAYQKELLSKKENQPIIEMITLDRESRELAIKKMIIRRGLDGRNL